MAATWQNIKLTNKGKALQAKMVAGNHFTLTSAVTSSTPITVAEQETIEELTNIEQTLIIQPVTMNSDGTALVQILLLNHQISTTYQAHVIGIYATDPDEGEILYCTVMDTTGEEIPSFQEAPNVTRLWKIKMGYGNADVVEVVVDAQAYTTHEWVDAKIETHNTDPEAHEGILTKMEALKQYIDDYAYDDTELQLTVAEIRAETEALAAGQVKLERKTDGLTADVAAIAFDLAVKDLLDTSELQNVVVDKFTALDDVILVSGHHGDGKVYI